MFLPTHCGLMTLYGVMEHGQHSCNVLLSDYVNQCWRIVNRIIGNKPVKFEWKHLPVPKNAVHYGDVIMSAMASQFTGVSIVCSIIFSASKKTSKLRVTGLCGGNPPATGGSTQRGPVTRKMFPFDDVIMWQYQQQKGGHFVQVPVRSHPYIR